MPEEPISRQQARDQVLASVRRLALYHAAMVQTLQAELGPEQGRALAAKVVERYGQKIGRAVRQRVEAAGLPAEPQNYSEDLPALAFEFSKVSDDPLTMRVHACPLAACWRELGCKDEGMLYCGVDQAKYREYNPELDCVHQTHCLRDGGDFCDIVVMPKSAGEPEGE